jgi:hypothetical protein
MLPNYASEDRNRERRRQAARTFLNRVLLVAVVAAAAVAYFAWPRIHVVETGRTPEYPDLKARDYDKGPAEITKAARAATDRLGWDYFGGGSGPGGSEVRVKVRLFKIPVPGQLVVHVKGNRGRSTMTVRSETEYGPWDFGQNARNIRAFFAEMDASME